MRLGLGFRTPPSVNSLFSDVPDKYTVRIVRTKNSILPLVNLTSTKSIVSTNHGSIVVIHMAGEDQIEDLAIPASRPLLIFNHNPKAGGGSILEVLREFKTQISCIKDKKEYGRCSAETWEQAFADDGAATSFVHVCEFCSTGRSDRVHGFIIGSIREPCSQYLSLWAFGSNGNGLFRHQFENDGKGFYGKSPPYFNTTSDKVRFQAWMKHPKVTGVVGDRVKQSYGESVLDSVDCWVFVEDFRRSLLNCLRLYEEQGGIVDWEAPLVEGLQQQQQQDPGKVNNVSDNGIRKASSKDDLTKASKNDPIGDPRSGHHGKCLPMFDDEVSKQVEEQNESFIYKLFGYEACCVPGSNFYPRIASSTAGKAGDASSLPSELLPTATSVGAMIAVTFLLTILLSIRKRLSRVTTTSTKKSAVELQCMLSNDYLVKKEENKVP